jgi:hypothetical protein
VYFIHSADDEASVGGDRDRILVLRKRMRKRQTNLRV